MLLVPSDAAVVNCYRAKQRGRGDGGSGGHALVRLERKKLHGVATSDRESPP
jgi:hypothetical protein